MKTWIKGGLWGLLITIIYFSLLVATFLLGSDPSERAGFSAYMGIISIILLIPFSALGRYLGTSTSTTIFFIKLFFPIVLTFFILGSLTGAIIGKIKKSKINPEETRQPINSTKLNLTKKFLPSKKKILISLISSFIISLITFLVLTFGIKSSSTFGDDMGIMAHATQRTSLVTFFILLILIYLIISLFTKSDKNKESPKEQPATTNQSSKNA